MKTVNETERESIIGWMDRVVEAHDVRFIRNVPYSFAQFAKGIRLINFNAFMNCSKAAGQPVEVNAYDNDESRLEAYFSYREQRFFCCISRAEFQQIMEDNV